MMEAEKIVIAITIILVIVIIILGLVYGDISGEELKEFCESKDGEYENYDCYLSENGVYQKYDIKYINNKWRLVK